MNGKETILLIDDDKEQGAIAQKTLTVLEYTAHAVISEEEAVTWLQSNSADLTPSGYDYGSWYERT